MGYLLKAHMYEGENTSLLTQTLSRKYGGLAAPSSKRQRVSVIAG